jgi:AcrR family transcriptional regulator
MKRRGDVAPRGYTLKRRAETAAATRDRILEAAAAVYRDQGVAAATLQAIADRASVSRGTVVNHFGGLEGLVEAVLDRAVDELVYPSPRDLEGASTRDERIRRFVEATYRFFDRSNAWWNVFAADTELPPIKRREREYYETFGAFVGAAFGELARDRYVAAAIRAFVDYPAWNALREGGLNLDESIGVIADALVNIARQRDGAQEGG